MNFITDQDYSVLIRTEIKDVLLENYSETKLRNAEQMAISQIKNYLAGKYDVEKIFSAKGEARNPHIVMITIDCALYHLYTANTARQMPEIRSQRYQDAIDWLKAVSKGEAIADLPKKLDEHDKPYLGFCIKSKHPKSSNRY